MEPDVKMRVLFVDDQPNIVQGLQRMLRSHRNLWDMVFASGSIEALRELASAPFDVIVTDMRMPIMNGAELLQEVRIQHPQTVRIALSGHTDRELILEAVQSTHQFLAKPCDAEVLKQTLSNCNSHANLLKNAELRKIICQTQSVPSLPSAYQGVMEALDEDNPDIHRIGSIIATDMGMSAKCLQLVNSAFFGVPRGACAPEQAVVLLGIDSLRTLLKSPQICTIFPCDNMQNLDIDDLWSHNVVTAKLSHKIAEHEGLSASQCDAAYVSGLLHDVGKLILAGLYPQLYDQLSTWSGIESCKMEKDQFGDSHDVIGGYLLSLWGYHSDMVEAVAYHHMPSNATLDRSDLLTIIHIANYIAQEYTFENGASANILDEEYLRAVGAWDRIDDWRALAPEIMMNGVYR